MSIPSLNLKELIRDSPDTTFKRSAGISPLKKKKPSRKLTNVSDSEKERRLGQGSSGDSIAGESNSPTKFERRNAKHLTVALVSSPTTGDQSARLRALGMKPVLTKEQQNEIARLKASARGRKMIVKAAPESSRGYDDGRIRGSDNEEVQTDSQDDLDNDEISDNADEVTDVYQETQVTQRNDSARNYQSSGAQTGINGELKLTRLSRDMFGTPVLKPWPSHAVNEILGAELGSKAEQKTQQEDETAAVVEQGVQPTTNLQRAPSFKEFTRTKSKVNQNGVKGTTSVYTNLFRKDSSFSILWNTAVMVCILLDLIIIPLELCSQDVEYIGWFSFIMLTVIQVCYLADLYINFNRTFYDQQVREVVDPSKIRIRYFESYDFMLDLFSCAPILAYRKIFCSSKGYNQLFLLIRIIKALKIKTIFIEFHQRFYVSSKLYFLGYLISVLTILHLETCIWHSVVINRYMMLKDQQAMHPACYQGTMQGCPEDLIPKEMMWLPPTYRNIEHEDQVKQFYEGSLLHKYAFIFYSSVLISSGNEIGPVTSSEAMLATSYIILGLILTGVILGNISDAIENMNEEETKFERSIDELQVKLKQNKVPEELQEKIMVYMQYCHQEGVEYNQTSDEFSYLARILRKEFMVHEYENLQRNIPLFSALDKEDMFEICSRFRNWIYLPGDIIVMQGEPCKEFYYIRKGKVKIVDHASQETVLLEEGECFNEFPFVFDSCVLNTVVADDFCIIDVLTKDSFDQIIETRPNMQREIKNGLKNSKKKETHEIIETLHKAPFFSDFTLEELKTFYKEYMDVLYLNPNTLLTSPSSKCNALYFVLQGQIHRFKKSEQNYEYIKMRLLDEEDTRKDYDTFLQQVDYVEARKNLEETKPHAVLTRGDWLGNLPITKFIRNYFFDISESFCQVVYISVMNLDELQNEGSKTSLVLYKKFEDAYKSHALPLLREVTKEYSDDQEVSFMEENKQTKELKLQKGLKELEQVLRLLITAPEQTRRMSISGDAPSLAANQPSGRLTGATPKSKKDSLGGDPVDQIFLKPSPDIGGKQHSRRLDSLATPSARTNKRFGTMMNPLPKY